MDWIRAHRKGILALIGAACALIVDETTAREIIAVADAVLVVLVPNDQAAIARIYGG